MQKDSAIRSLPWGATPMGCGKATWLAASVSKHPEQEGMVQQVQESGSSGGRDGDSRGFLRALGMRPAPSSFRENLTQNVSPRHTALCNPALTVAARHYSQAKQKKETKTWVLAAFSLRHMHPEPSRRLGCNGGVWDYPEL
jgi:hypothetical protein